MKRSTFASFSAAGALMLALAPGVSHAQWDGQVKFVGKISDTTCLINGNMPGMNNITEVPLGEYEPSFFSAIGTKSTPEPFSIELTSNGPTAVCDASKTASVVFDQNSPHIDKSSGNLKINSTSPAVGIQIEIADFGNGKAGKINLGAAQTDPQKVLLAGNKGTLKFTANYVSTAGTVTGGSANSIIPFMVVYQ
ncbi:fimbrial protein [Achromobacter marplatensis]|uniref:Major type 1 subunit fimbrin (Pilin) n=1 Tax=Achromobacter marplatensis TaxID=470868 RepID=A0ABX9GK80_9BURK|nr:fimbrial protein [Achromobacter marplatensis]OWT72003.1 fimbrial protein [Achromobacter marplatensis]RBP24735.1 major type 1 subunit fimbrin (pilin) [Achromobacter marplatensis]CAB3624762.1 putative major fimbrial subunit LpfA [Achromobacter marplatensis]